MNIANIFGLHLNCKVKVYNATAIIKSVFSNGDVELLFAFEKETSMGKTKDCKLLLKPLSAMSDEDKREFLNKFYPESHKFWRYMRIIGFNKEGIEVYSTRENGCPYPYIRKYLIEEALWLASKGYDVGIVPDEYKEIVE